MTIPFRTPHTVTLKRPTPTRDAETKVGSWNYATPLLTASRTGLYQERAGRELVDGAGETFRPDAVFYTKDSNVLIADMIEVLSLKLIVVDVQNKYDLAGVYSHTEVALVRDIIR